MIAVIDYGAGNLFSVKNALEYLKQPYLITNDIDQIRNADGYILPGVGAFPFAMKQLTATGLPGAIGNCLESVWECRCCLRKAQNLS